VAPRIEGTFGLEGLIEGRLPPDPEAAKRLRDWVDAVAQLGLEVQLEVEGGSFSFLAGDSRVLASTLGPRPAERVRDLVEQLARSFDDPAAAGLFSTLRSVEVRPGAEIQTVYAIHADGSVEAPEREVEAVTTPPAAPTSARDWVKVAAVSVVLLAALLGITSFFVDWKAAAESLWNKVVPLDVSELEITSDFDLFFGVVAREGAGGGAVVKLTLERTDAFPRDDDALRRAYEQAGHASPRERLILDALGRGYVRAEIFGEDGSFLAFHEVRVAALAEDERIVVDVSLPRDPRPARIRLVP